MNNSTFTLVFPADSGFSKTDIFFHQGTPDLSILSDKTDCSRRLFVTDLTIASLPAVKSFCDSFEKVKLDCIPSPAWTGKRGNDVLLVLGAGETYKTIDSVLSIVKAALEFNFDRNCLFTAIGGGVICDMTGFAASMYKRGVKVSFVPTTLLAMVDASTGGKTGCDFEGYKNMIGAFWPAESLHIWPDFVKTLPENEYISGLSEAIKTALLFNGKTVEMFANNTEKVLSRDSGILFDVIRQCVEAKAAIVQEDLKEKGRRAFLNLGHTFGHALEAVAGLGKITHGEAVAWGMGRAAVLSSAKGLSDREYCSKVLELLSSYGYDTKAYPSVLAEQNMKSEDTIPLMMKAMRKDKKNNSDSGIRVILQKKVEDTVIQTVSEQEIESVLR